MGLLWASHSREVGRTGLTINDFVGAAMDLAREEGVAALSMRGIAMRLNVRPMAMYSAVPSKQDLVALMVDRAYRDCYSDSAVPVAGDWRAGLRQAALANRTLYLKHPWLLELAPARSPMGPHEARKTEFELRALDGIGLSETQMEQTLSLVLAHVAQQARLEAQLLNEKRETGLDDAEWWVETMPVLKRVYDPAHFPLLMRVGAAAGATRQDQSWTQASFDFGLERILDGVAALLGGQKP